MYEHVPRSIIVESLRHLRELLRQVPPANDSERLAAEQREIVAKYLISNLPRTSEHPTLKSLIEVAEAFRLTIGAAHQLFGYDLEALRREELFWNAGRTHIIESYIFDRDRLIDLPAELAVEDAFRSDAMLSDLVRKWQPPIPIRIIEEQLLPSLGLFYVQVGTEDGENANLPPGSIALVEPIDHMEASRPNPRLIYLLQFGDGYRCSRCVVAHGKLQMLTSPRKYIRAREFACPGQVRVVGRIRTFVHELPQPTYERNDQPQSDRRLAELILPWEQRTRHGLFSTEHRRFRRKANEEAVIRNYLKELLRSSLTERTERRYRGPGLSHPHVSTLIQLTLLYYARYSDALRVSGSAISDRGRYSLDAMLESESIEDLRSTHTARTPKPEAVWNLCRREFLERAPLLSFKFPKFSLRRDPVARLSQPRALQGLEPPLTAGSWLLLQALEKPPQVMDNLERMGWERPVYLLRRGLDLAVGHLEREGSGFALHSTISGASKRRLIELHEATSLEQVVGVAVPV